MVSLDTFIGVCQVENRVKDWGRQLKQKGHIQNKALKTVVWGMVCFSRLMFRVYIPSLLYCITLALDSPGLACSAHWEGGARMGTQDEFVARAGVGTSYLLEERLNLNV